MHLIVFVFFISSSPLIFVFLLFFLFLYFFLFEQVEGWYPQIKLLDELHKESPNSTFVLNFRPIKDWLHSVSKWDGMKYRMSLFEMPGFVLTEEQHKAVKIQRKWHLDLNEYAKLSKSSREKFHENYYKENPSSASALAVVSKRRNLKSSKGKKNAKGEEVGADRLKFPIPRPPRPEPVNDIQLARWWCGHVKHIRKYVELYRSHKLIELELYDNDSSSSVLYDMFQRPPSSSPSDSNNNNCEDDKKNDDACWGHANVNKKIVLKRKQQ
jgi:hypothetical protein